MKYQVQIKYTNPAHEHVSLRRRVETITRLVEASNETEAINRAANQQRSLGFMIKEAEIMKPDVADKTETKDKKKKKVVGDDTENTDVAAASGSVKEDSDKKDDKETKRMQNKLESGRMSPSEVEKKLKKESYPLLKPGQKIKAMKLKMKEEVVTEASKEGKDVMRGMRASLKSMDIRHNVDSDKRVSGYKMSPVVRAAQKKSDALSKVVKRPQAGTIAAVHRSMERQMQKESVEYIEEKLTAADPASKWISDFVKSDNPKFAGKSKKERINMALGAHYAAKRAKNEGVDLDESKHEGKKEARKTGEKRENILQGKVNKINMTPELDQKINGVK